MKKSKYLLGLIIIISFLAIIYIYTTYQSNKDKVSQETTTTDENVAVQQEQQDNKNDVTEPRILVHQNGNQVRITSYGNATILEFCTDNIIKINYLPDKLKGVSAGVVGRFSWQPVEYELVDKEANPIVLKTKYIKVEFDKFTSEIKVYNNEDELIITQSSMEKEISDEVTFIHESGQNFYGISGYSASERSKELMLRNEGGRVEAGEQGNSGAPLVWTNSGYGILFDSDGGYFKMDDTSINFSDNSKKDIEYYVILGDPVDIMSGVAKISGTPPMFPKWAMGFTNSEWGIDQQELEEIIDTYRQKEIPIDNYTLDFDWKAWGEDNYGEFRWNDEKFPDGSSGKLSQDLLENGIKLTGIMKPRILTGTIQGDYALEHGYFYPNRKAYPEYFSGKLANDIDFSNPVARTWYFDHSKEAFDTGIIGWWNDEADEGFGNLQHMNMQMALYQGQRAYTDQRVWSLNRNFYLGAQRYAYGLWSGDINSGFSSMQNQRERMLSNINLGEMKWGMDTGGFNGANPSAENYARWMQFSAFTPIFRVHSRLDMQRQPWIFGEKAEEASKEVMYLRYKLLPYIYSYERQAYETGIGLVKPLLFDYPEDVNVVNLIDSWMFGDYLLVSPIVEEKQKEKEIYLPEGTWIDYFRGTIHEGGQTITYKVTDDSWNDIPLFIKQGAIIPSQEYMNYVGEKDVKNIFVDYFPDEKPTSFMYYDDDGETYSYENGIYFKQYFNMQKTDEGISIGISATEGNYVPALESYIIKLHGIKANEVSLNGVSLNIYNSLEDLVSFDEGVCTGIDKYGDVTYIKIKSSTLSELVVRNTHN